MNSNNNNRHLKLILGQQTVSRLTQLRVLLVGAGGIGCEVAKNVVSVGVRRLAVVDFDHIEETNLNRQFYFRRSHVGLPKATVLKQEL